ncbi:hypothetical protein AAG906_015681 [Vitis piasezkii]
MKTKSSAPMPIASAGMTNTCYLGSLESHSSAPFRTSQGSMDIGDALDSKMGSVGRSIDVASFKNYEELC